MQRFKKKVELLVERTEEGRRRQGAHAGRDVLRLPERVAPICQRLGITSHGLAMFLLEGADDTKGVACLGGECFGPAGQGFLRFSCAEPDERLRAGGGVPEGGDHADGSRAAVSGGASEVSVTMKVKRHSH